MSGIFGVFNRNGKPVDKEIANTMLDAMSYWNPDECDVFIDGPVTLGHTMLWNTPESKYEHMPLVQEAYVITIDARIDNRDELANELELPNRPLEEIGDSEFVLAAYKKWGEDCAKYLLGDFTFAIWDEIKEQIYCARDHIGIKPFYYHLSDDLFIFGNDTRGIISHPDVSRNYCNQMILAYMHEIEQKNLTFYEDIKKIQPAHIFIVTKNIVKNFTYWKAEDSKEIRLNTVDDYSNMLNDLLLKSVKARLRSDYSMAAHLSGGLDSSAIAVLAARELKKQHRNILTYSWLHSPTEKDDHTHFEWSNAERVAKLEGITHNYINMNIEIFNDIYKNLNISHMDRLDFWNEFLVRKSVNKSKARTILSGWGGDELVSFDGGVSIYAELFWQGKVFDSIRHYYVESKKSNSSLLTFGKTILKELVLPSFSNKYFDRLYNRFSSSFYSDIDPLENMKDDYLENVKDISIKPHNEPRNLASRAEQLNRFYLGSLTGRTESWASSAFKVHIEYRYPLLDKRLVEFALGIPLDLYERDGHNRYLYRYAISDYIPKDIVWSNTKHENERADKYIRLLFEFLKKWLNEHKNHYSKYVHNKYIDICKLIKYIENITDEELKLDNMIQIRKMMIAGKSILLLHMID